MQPTQGHAGPVACSTNFDGTCNVRRSVLQVPLRYGAVAPRKNIFDSSQSYRQAVVPAYLEVLDLPRDIPPVRRTFVELDFHCSAERFAEPRGKGATVNVPQTV